jgi:hypothetical protein
MLELCLKRSKTGRNVLITSLTFLDAREGFSSHSTAGSGPESVRFDSRIVVDSWRGGGQKVEFWGESIESSQNFGRVNGSS